jgi:hypothetical protein
VSNGEASGAKNWLEFTDIEVHTSTYEIRMNCHQYIFHINLDRVWMNAVKGGENVQIYLALQPHNSQLFPELQPERGRAACRGPEMFNL